MRAMRHWLEAHLLKCGLRPFQARVMVTPPQAPEPGLDVLANNDAVVQNGRGSMPLKIGSREFTRGLYCHAVSKVVVRLPVPGRGVSAVVGLDHNPDTARGKGIVVFTVTRKDRLVFYRKTDGHVKPTQ
jgi:hypothetical protein